MRVIRNEQGAVAVIVAICSLMIFGLAAYAIDAGHLWEERRNLVTATDAAALGAAKDYALSTDGCSTAASQLVTANHADATVTSCLPVGGSVAPAGRVTVKAQTRVDYTFAQIFGQSSKQITSATTAEWGFPTAAYGLRPFGLCIDANAIFAAWLNRPSGPTSDSGTIRITYGKAQPSACGTVPGNWGVMDFNGGANATTETRDWTRYGYDGLVSVNDNVPGNTGSFSNSLDGELAYLKSSGEAFALPIFDTASGSGSNAQFHIVGFVFVKLIDYRTTGPEAGRFMDLVFTRGVISGTCCASSGINTLVRVVRICDVDTLTPNITDPRAC